ETERPEMAPEGDRALPVDRGAEPGIVVGQRVGHDMGRREGDAVEGRPGALESPGGPERIGRQFAGADGKIERRHAVTPSVPEDRSSGAPSSSSGRPRRAARPWRPPAAST